LVGILLSLREVDGSIPLEQIQCLDQISKADGLTFHLVYGPPQTYSFEKDYLSGLWTVYFPLIPSTFLLFTSHDHGGGSGILRQFVSASGK
jgi:hypothetical protein